MNASNPTSHGTATPTAYSAADARPVRVPTQTSTETKSFYKTSEFIVYVVAVVGVLVASFLVSTTEAHEDYFRSDQAWLYVAILSVGYMVSRGLAKSGSRHHGDA